MPRKLITKQRFAELLGVHPVTVMRRVKTETGFPQPAYSGPDIIGPNGEPCKANVRFYEDEAGSHIESLRRQPSAAA